MAEFKGVQGDILSSKDKNQLVSAGAGSGKTTIMIEKISNLILIDKVPISSLLVVTFTVLAAQEMKERLIAKMREKIQNTNDEEEKQNILSIIEDVKIASIDTIDGFSSKTIKKYFYELEISPNVEIISDATRDYYINNAMKQTIEDYSIHTDEINMLLDLFGGGRRNLKTIEELILTHYYNVMNIDDYESFLDMAYNEYIDSSKSEKIVNDYLCNIAENLKRKIIHNYSFFVSNIQRKLDNCLLEFKKFDKNSSLKDNLINLKTFKLESFTTKEYKENEGLKILNSQIKEMLEIQKKFEKMGINEDFSIKNSEIINILRIFFNLLRNFINNYNSLKNKSNLIDFNDLNRLMIKLLKNEKIRKELQDKYKYIFIDEYQDVNPLQDGLLSKVVGEDSHLFMVGDVKQSIYGFRGASPEWFLNKYNNFKEDTLLGTAFDMNVNFRSSPTVLQFINDIFVKLMTKESMEIDYKNDCLIEPQRNDILDDKVKIMLVSDTKKDVASGLYSVREHEESKSISTIGKEALLVLKIITDLIGTEFYDAKKKIRRNLTYRDIAILSRSEKDEGAQTLIKLLRSHAVPLNINNKLVIDESEGVKLILSIFRCIIGSHDDVDYLAVFLCLTELTIDDIIHIRDKSKSLYENLKDNIDNPTIKGGFDALLDIREKSYVMTIKELIRYILNNHGLRYFIKRKVEGERELLMLEEFVSKISTVEDGLNLAEFVEVIENSVSNGSDFATIDSEDSVALETIHKSKGLEYPVVILYNASKEFSYIREHDGINFSTDIGFGFYHFDMKNRVKSYSVPKYAIKLINSDKGYKEELRLLYVALTRAKNKLYITGHYNPEDIENKTISKTNYMNCILDCFIDGINGDYTEFQNCTIEFIDEEFELDEGGDVSFTTVERIDEGFNYPNQEKFNISFKNSVTAINKEKYGSQEIDNVDIANQEVQYELNDDRANIGIHYHSALEMLDFRHDYVKNTNFEDVDYTKIKRAHEILSNLVCGCKNIEKEAEFTMYIPYNEISDTDIKDKLLVQGVVDMIVEYDDYIVIVDYKMSNLNINTLKKKYAEQLSLYKIAVERAYHKPVKNCYIYSINTGELA